jgi:hypothetical protein
MKRRFETAAKRRKRLVEKSNKTDECPEKNPTILQVKNPHNPQTSSN